MKLFCRPEVLHSTPAPVCSCRPVSSGHLAAGHVHISPASECQMPGKPQHHLPESWRLKPVTAPIRHSQGNTSASTLDLPCAGKLTKSQEAPGCSTLAVAVTKRSDAASLWHPLPAYLGSCCLTPSSSTRARCSFPTTAPDPSPASPCSAAQGVAYLMQVTV